MPVLDLHALQSPDVRLHLHGLFRLHGLHGDHCMRSAEQLHGSHALHVRQRVRRLVSVHSDLCPRRGRRHGAVGLFVPEREEQRARERMQPQTLDQVTELEQKLTEALDELRQRREELERREQGEGE